VLAAHRQQLEEQLAEVQANLDEVKVHEKEARALLARTDKAALPAWRRRQAGRGCAMTAIFERVQKSFERQGMMQHLDARLVKVEHGLVELVLPYSDKVTQQQDGFHGGAMGAVADIAGGYAALTVTPEGSEVVTVEYKINFLGSFKGGELRATGRVVKGGKRIIVTTAEVVHVDDEGKTSPCAVMQQTLVPVPKNY
jgi:uncharacterized protein (TIGR00369 family)